MKERISHLTNIISLAGVSGYETPVRRALAETWEPLADEFSVSRVGSLHALKRGEGPDPRPKVMLSAHMDGVGLMVTEVKDGFIQVTSIGGLDARILPSQPVVVHGRRELEGVIVMPSPRQLPDDLARKPVPMKYLLVETGLPADEVAELVRPGDVVSFATTPMMLEGDFVAGHSLDNRASVAALTVCLDVLQSMRHEWDVVTTATVQEEFNHLGGRTSPVSVQPDLAVVIDVTYGVGPGASGFNVYPLESGPALGWGPTVHPALYHRFKELAEKLEMPYRKDLLPRLSWTETDNMQLVGGGIPTILLSIPLRYMHTPVEMIAWKDVERTGRLMAQFVSELPLDYVENMRWDES
jgi:tetrahedral aminopeptidase